MTNGFANGERPPLNSNNFAANNSTSYAYEKAFVNTNTLPSDFFQQSGYSSYSDFYKNMTKFFNLDNPAPFVSAKSWIMTNLNTGEIMYAKREKE